MCIVTEATEKAGKDELDRVFVEEDAHRVAEEAVGRSSCNNNGICDRASEN